MLPLGVGVGPWCLSCCNLGQKTRAELIGLWGALQPFDLPQWISPTVSTRSIDEDELRALFAVREAQSLCERGIMKLEPLAKPHLGLAAPPANDRNVD